MLAHDLPSETDIFLDQGHPVPGAATCPDNSGGKMSCYPTATSPALLAGDPGATAALGKCRCAEDRAARRPPPLSFGLGGGEQLTRCASVVNESDQARPDGAAVVSGPKFNSSAQEWEAPNLRILPRAFASGSCELSVPKAGFSEHDGPSTTVSDEYWLALGRGLRATSRLSRDP